MPRAIASINRERTIGGLVDNLFVFDGPNRAEDRRRAERALLRDNPTLNLRENFRAGATLVIPVDLGLRTTDRVSRPDVNLGGLIDESAQRLALADSTIREGLAQRKETNGAAIDRLSDRQFRDAVRKASPAAAERLIELRDRLVDEDEEAVTIGEALAEALAAASAEIKRLRAMAGSAGGDTPSIPSRGPSIPSRGPSSPISGRRS